jgi:diacylglycerol kinase family enzyme
MRILFVLNPTAGGSSKDAWEEAIGALSKDSAHSTEVFRMESDDCSTELGERLAAFQPDRVGAIGGDGTLKFVAEVLVGTGIPIAFLPAGSANGMARELDLPTDPEDVMRILLEGEPRAMDAVMLNGNLSIHLADLGLNAQLVKYFDEAEQRGMVGYARQVARVMRNGHQMRLTIVQQGIEWKRKAWMLVFANARTYGTGALINPEGSLYDGRFELVLLKRRWFWEMIKMLVRRKPAKNDQLTEVLQVEHVTVRTTRAAHFQVDGEYLGKVTEVEAKIERGAVVILLPKQAS